MSTANTEHLSEWQRAPVDSPLRLLALLCAWAGGKVDDEQSARITGLAKQIDDWPRFITLVEQHRVAGLVNAAFRDTGARVPAEVRDAVAAHAKRIARANLMAATEIVRLQRSFDQAGIIPVFFKGLAVAEGAYGNIATKHSKDIDFIVPTQDVTRVVALLEHAGYRFPSPHPPAHSARWQSLLRILVEVEMVHEKTLMRIEPHWALDQARMLPVDALMARSSKQYFDIAGVPIRTFHPDDRFAYLCVHGAKTGWHRLKWLADLHALVRNADDDELRRLVDHAGHLRVDGCAVIALSLCAIVFGLPVPRDILDRAKSGWARRQFVAFSLANLGRPEERAFRLSPIGALLMAAVQGYPVRQLGSWWVSHADVRILSLPRSLEWLYPLIRLPSLLIRRFR